MPYPGNWTAEKQSASNHREWLKRKAFVAENVIGHPEHPMHGTPKAYKYGCRCERCRDAKRADDHEGREKRRQRDAGATRRGEPWTTGEQKRLAELYETMTAPEVARELGRTVYAVQNRASKMGLRKEGKELRK